MKPIDNLLRQRLYRTQTPLIEHPPIDLLGAFAERALSGSDSAPVLEHLAHCPDCREIVFLSSPEIAPARIDGLPARPASRSSWVSWPVLRWGSAAAYAVIVVAAMRLHPGYRGARVEAPSTTPQNHQALRAEATPGTEAAASVEPPSVRQSNRRISGEPGKAKAVPELLELRYDTAFYRQMALLKEGADNITNRPPRWTLAADGTLQRSLDGGVSWTKINVAPGQVFRAVAAEGRSVWLGGEKGVLFHSADAGRHWSQMKQNAGQPLPEADIVGIEFEDELHGKLTTGSSESWSTADGGHSWQKQ